VEQSFFYLRNNALAERDPYVTYAIRAKNTQRELGRNEAFVKKESGWDTARKKENVRTVKFEHWPQNSNLLFIPTHIHMY